MRDTPENLGFYYRPTSMPNNIAEPSRVSMMKFFNGNS